MFTGLTVKNLTNLILALIDGETGNYILNGGSVVSPFPKDIIYSGMNINYSGSNASIETVTTPKNEKLLKDLVVQLLSVCKTTPDVTYRYTIGNIKLIL